MNKGPIAKTDGPNSNVKTDGRSPNTICLGTKTPNTELRVVIVSSLFFDPLAASAALRVERSTEAVELRWRNLTTPAAVICNFGSEKCCYRRDGQLCEEATY
ncbi:hypothetical protein GmHk_14G041683 [Glycine max]|nr:hypothetical protein GmHk_14G041683 [Glycine max]